MLQKNPHRSSINKPWEGANDWGCQGMPIRVYGVYNLNEHIRLPSPVLHRNQPADRRYLSYAMHVVTWSDASGASQGDFERGGAALVGVIEVAK